MVVVMPYQRVLLYRRGRLAKVLEAGKHRTFGFNVKLVRIDARMSIIDVRAQEVPTSDGITVKVSAAIHVRLSDPVALHEVTQDPTGFVYDAAKSVLRDLVRTRTLDEVVEGLTTEEIPAEIAAAAETVGLEVIAFDLRDVIVPGEIRRANEELVTTRQQAQIALERARSEIAVLRAQANSAKLLEDHPTLASIRLAEAAASGGGVVIIERPKA